MQHRRQWLLISTLLLLATGLTVAATASGTADPPVSDTAPPHLVALDKAAVGAKTLPVSPDTGPCWVRLNDAPAGYPSVQAAVDASAQPTDVVKVAGTCAGWSSAPTSPRRFT